MPDQSSASGRTIRALLLAFVLATCLRTWIGPSAGVPEAQAQIPDAGNQRIELLREARRTNELLADILDTLRNDTLKVEMDGTDNKVAPEVRPPGGRRP